MTHKELEYKVDTLYDSVTDIKKLLVANNKLLKTIIVMLHHENSTDFTNNIVANIIGNGIMPMR